MFRCGILALLLCSQLAAPALSGRFVCLAANGCICVDDGPQTCTCCKVQAKAPSSCSCGCHEEQLPQGVDEGSQDCTHIAVGDYHTPVKVQISINVAPEALPITLVICTPPVAAASTARRSLLSHDSATLAVLATVVLRI